MTGGGTPATVSSDPEHHLGCQVQPHANGDCERKYLDREQRKRLADNSFTTGNGSNPALGRVDLECHGFQPCPATEFTAARLAGRVCDDQFVVARGEPYVH